MKTRELTMIWSILLSSLIPTWAASHIIAWGDVDQSTVPPGLTNIVGVAAGHFHNLCLGADGILSAWPTSTYDPGSQLPGGLTDVVRMGAGVAHDLAVRADGTVTAWGDNTASQTAVPPGLKDVVEVAAGGYHCLALKVDGSVVAWGDNSYGQIAVPASATNVVAIAAGFFHSLALRADGGIVCWGDNSFGQTDIPTMLKATAIAAGGDHCLALTSKGAVVAWGDNEYGQSEVPSDLTNALAIAAGDYHNLALRADRTIVAWGPLNSSTVVPAGMSNVFALSAGGSHSLALSQDNTPFLTRPISYRTAVCGATVVLGSGFPDNSSMNFQWMVAGTVLATATNAQLTLENVQTNQTGAYSIVVSNAVGLVENAITMLTVVPSLVLSPPMSQTNVAGMTVNLNVSALSITALGYQWRFNSTNIPGATNNTLILPNVTPNQAGAYSVILSNAYGIVVSPDAILSIINIFQWSSSRLIGMNAGNAVAMTISGNGNAVIARTDGTVAALGLWSFGSGSGLIPPAGLSNVIAVAAGYEHALALRADGTVVAWGSNYYGQTNVPSDLTNAVAIAAGALHSLALRADGTVAAWGSDDAGDTEIPSGLANIVAIAAGSDDSTAVTSDGHVIVWGTTSSGDFEVPLDATNVVAIAEGESDFLALKADGTVVGWGYDSYGQTEPPAALTNAIAISAAGLSSLALTSKGNVVAWGVGAAQQTNALGGLSNVVAIAAGYNAGPNNLALIGSGPPHLTTLLVGRTVAAGSTTSFSATATGQPPLGFQWQFNGTDLAGATNSVLTLRDVQPSQAGEYSVTVSNALGSARSGSTSLEVVPMLLSGVNSEPHNNLAYVGGTAWFSVAAQGLDLKYQWLTNGTPIPGATNSFLTLTNIQLSQAGGYSVSVSNSSGQLISAIVPLQVQPIWITFNSPSQTNYAGGNSLLAVGVAGLPPISYQWMFNGVALPGATNFLLTLNNVQLSQAGNYSLLVTNAFGMTNSVPISLTIEPIVILSQPRSLTNSPGAQVSFEVVAGGIGPFNYQWFLNGLAIDGATNDTLSFVAVPSLSGTYSVTVSNAYGIVTSEKANLVVLNLVEWQSDFVEPPRLFSIPAELASIAASRAGWGVATTADGAVIALPGGSAAPPLVPGGLTNAVSVSAGLLHGLALKADGRILAWGDNSLGQTNSPADLTDVVSIAAGDFHNLVLKANGSVVAWGNNAFGQTNVPADLTNVVAIAAGTNASLALTRDGQVTAWGADNLGHPLNAPPSLTNVIALASGNSIVVVLRSDATVAVWQTAFPGPPYTPPTLSNIVAIAASADNDWELTVEGTILSWANSTNVPTGISNVVSLAAGGHNWALLGSGAPVVHSYLSALGYFDNHFSIELPTRAGRVYSLEYKDSLLENEWKPLPLVAGKGVMTLSDPTVTAAHRFYRVRQW